MDELSNGLRAVSRSVDHLDLAGLGGDSILGTVLITIGVSSDNDGLGPARNESRDVLNDDRFTENGTIENVSNSSIGRLPHLLQSKLLNTALIRGDSGALHTDLGALHSLSAVNCNLIVGFVTVLD